MEHHEADIRPVAGRGTSGDDATRFLCALRQLRSSAGLGHAELAARAHYPYDSIRAAEVGPSLPDLPVLCAFVRGCGGTTEEWEERWRSLTKSPSLPVPATRHSGQSDAATAGARINAAAPPEDAPDPTIVIAALNRVARELASPGGARAVSEPPAAGPLPDFTSPPPSRGKLQGGDKATGWDPIRVSAAWPVLGHTPTITEPVRDAEVPGGAGKPWDTAPLAADPASSASTVGGSAASVTSASVPGSGGPGRSSRTMIVVVAVVALCVVAALLAILL